MIDQYTVVAAIPAGRRRYLEILLPYLWAQRGVLDRCDLWCNTTEGSDVAYLRQIAAANPFFRVIEARVPVEGVHSVYHFFRYCVEPKTVYVRFDDDICWIAGDVVETLVRFRLQNPAHPIVFANTVNNGVCSFLHQRMGCIPADRSRCRYGASDDTGWHSGPFAQLAHESFLQALEQNTISDYLFKQWIAVDFEHLSINCICWLGQDFAEFGGEVGKDDEVWLTMAYPADQQRPNVICGSALVSHFAYWPQRPWLEGNTNLLERYKTLAQRLPLISKACRPPAVRDAKEDADGGESSVVSSTPSGQTPHVL